MNSEDGLRQRTVLIDGMHCERCAMTVRDELLSLDGVDMVEAEVGRAVVHYLPQLVSDEQIEAAVVEAGFSLRTTETKKGPLGRFIDRMIASNEQNFGNERLDCCNLTPKKR